jgi:hypothetical protein
MLAHSQKSPMVKAPSSAMSFSVGFRPGRVEDVRTIADADGELGPSNYVFNSMTVFP